MSRMRVNGTDTAIDIRTHNTETVRETLTDTHTHTHVYTYIYMHTYIQHKYIHTHDIYIHVCNSIYLLY